MKILSPFSFETKDELALIAKKIIEILGLQITDTTIKSDLLNHPDYPSLLSISDILASYGIANVSLVCTQGKLAALPIPFIAQIKNDSQQNTLTIVKEVTNDTVVCYQAKQDCWLPISIAEFQKKWPSGIVSLVDSENGRHETDYTKKRREEKKRILAKYAVFFALPAITLSACLWTLSYDVSYAYPSIFTIFTLAGSIVGTLLLLYELDAYNPLLQQLCTSGKKINCGAILDSKAAKIMGISWSTIGFTYFMGAQLLLLFTGIANPSTLFIVSWLNVFAVPYIFYSIYYQWRIAKQWCVLCLAVQGLLALQCITAVMAGWHTTVSLASIFSPTILVPAITAYVLPFVIVRLLLPSYRIEKESKRYKSELQRLKNNAQIFAALLHKQKAIVESTDGLGISLGNPNATHKLIKVCNPYCGPCAKAHVAMDELLHNNPDLQIQIIFTATNEEHDKRTLPAKHLLAIAGRSNEMLTQQALNDWYTAEEKNYEVFAIKYPINGEFQQQIQKIDAMDGWCKKNGIAFTPTFFVDGYQLPEMYTISDLKYLLLTS